MANLGQKSGVFHVRFRFHSKEYKKSLKTRDRSAAEAAVHLIELTVHRLHTGQCRVPEGVDPGDFIVSGGTLLQPITPPVKFATPPSTRAMAEEYKTSQKDLLAPSYHYSQAMHLRHLLRHLGELADVPCGRIDFRELDRYIKVRLSQRHPNSSHRRPARCFQDVPGALDVHIETKPVEGVILVIAFVTGGDGEMEHGIDALHDGRHLCDGDTVTSRRRHWQWGRPVPERGTPVNRGN